MVIFSHKNGTVFYLVNSGSKRKRGRFSSSSSDWSNNSDRQADTRETEDRLMDISNSSTSSEDSLKKFIQNLFPDTCGAREIKCDKWSLTKSARERPIMRERDVTNFKFYKKMYL